MHRVVELALREWEAIIVAPDVPSRQWADQVSERAVLALLDHVMAHHAIDRDRILVTGFSMGGRGTWFFATRHADLFTGAIPMAASRGDDSLDGLGTMPVHIIHSPDDEVMPYGPAQETAELLAERGHPVRLLRVGGLGHYNMGGYIEPLQMAGEWRKGMSRELLKLSGSLVHDYATISDDSPSPNRASRARRAATSAGIS